MGRKLSNLRSSALLGSWIPRYMYRKPVHPTPTCRRILALVRKTIPDLPGPDEHWRIARLHTGRHQRSAGAWSWALDWAGPDSNTSARATSGTIGSQWPAVTVARYSFLLRGETGYDLEFDPPKGWKPDPPKGWKPDPPKRRK